MNLTRGMHPNGPGCYARDGEVACEECKHLVVFGKVSYCGYVPQRLTLRDVIKMEARDEDNEAKLCCFCAHNHNKLDSQTCLECLGTEHLDNFKAHKGVPEWWIRRYKYEEAHHD